MHRRLDERRVDDRLGDPLGLGPVAGPVDVAPRSASRRPRRRGRSAWSATAATAPSAASSSPRSTAPAAPLARTTAVSLVDVSVSIADAVERAVDDTPEDRRRARRRRPSASVSSTAIIVAMSGSIIPTPLAMPTTRAGRRRPCAAATFGTVSVVMIPRAAASASVPTGSGRHRGHAGQDPIHRVAPADHARRRDQHVAAATAEPLPATADDDLGVGQTLGAGRDVGVLRHDHDRLRPAVGDVVPTDRRRSGRRSGCA